MYFVRCKPQSHNRVLSTAPVWPVRRVRACVPAAAVLAPRAVLCWCRPPRQPCHAGAPPPPLRAGSIAPGLTARPCTLPTPLLSVRARVQNK